MKLTKHAHACVAVEQAGTTIVIDPGTFTPNPAEVISGAAAVLVTHEHFDHFDGAAIAAALDRQPDLRVYGPAPVCEKLGPHDGRVTAVVSGDELQIGGLNLKVHGRHHALIHVDVPIVDNVGYLIDESVFHPGDAYFVPGAAIDTLLLPTSGPWTKLGEAADYVRAVRPRRVVQIHELMLSELGQSSAAMFLGEDGLTGIPFTILPAGESITA